MIPLFILAHFLHHVLTSIPVPLLPMIRSDLGLDYAGSGLLFSAFNFSYGLSQVPAGWLTDRTGPRLMMAIGICGVAAAGFFVGLSQGYLMLAIFLALMGMMGGGYHPASTQLISSLEPSRRGRFLGLHMIGGSGSYFLSPLIAAGIASLVGWRGPFLLMAVPIFIFGILVYSLMGANVMTAIPARHTATASIAAPPRRLYRLVVFLVMSTTVHALVFSVISFVALYLSDYFGIAKTTAATAVAFVYSAGLWINPISGYLSDRIGRIPIVLAAFFSLGPVVFLLGRVPYGLGIPALLFVFGALMYLYPAVAQAFVFENSPERHRSTMLGIFFFGNQEGGALMAPLLGRLIDNVGFQTSFMIAGVGIFTATLVCATLLRFGREQPAVSPA